MNQEFLKALYKEAFEQGVKAKTICGGLAKTQMSDDNFHKALAYAIHNVSKDKR